MCNRWHIKPWQIKQMSVIVKTRCLHNCNNISQSKLNKNDFAHHLRYIQLQTLEIFITAFFVKNRYWNSKSYIMALSSVVRCSPYIKKHQKVASRLKMKILDITRETLTLKRENEKWKTKNIRKRNNSNKLLYFYFLYIEKFILFSKI